MRNLYHRYRYFVVKAMNVVIVAALLVCFNAWASEALAHDEEVEAQILAAQRAASRGAYPTDGTFTGSAQGYGGPVVMQVVIDNGYIDSVEIVDASQEDEAWLEMCLGVPDAIVKAQTTGIDTVSGATFTSGGMLNGATEALRKSMEGAA